MASKKEDLENVKLRCLELLPSMIPELQSAVVGSKYYETLAEDLQHDVRVALKVLIYFVSLTTLDARINNKNFKIWYTI